MEMAQRARALQAQAQAQAQTQTHGQAEGLARGGGREVISLALGEPDFPTPGPVVEAACRAARAGETRYPPLTGTPALKQAVRDKFARENGLDFADGEILVGNGGKQILFNALMATLEPGAEVVIPRPYWASYPLTVRMLGGTPVFVDCPEADGFRLDAGALAGAIGPRTRWVILNLPCNPTGASCDEAGLRAIADVLRRHPHVWILCDEIYEHLLFTSQSHRSLASLAPDLLPRLLILSGVSKTYAMTGWRIGFGAGPARLIAAMSVVQGNATSGACSVSQAAAAAALRGDQGVVGVMRDTYRARRDRIVAALRAMPGVRCALPDGAFYAYPSIAGCIGRTSPGGRLIDSDKAFALALLEEQHVAVVQGSAFGMSPYLRLSTAAADAALDEACRRMDAFCRGLTLA